MGKSRVEKNKKLYDQLDSNDMEHHGIDLDAFELEDLGDISDKEKEDFELEDLTDAVTEDIITPIVEPEPIVEPVKEPKKKPSKKLPMVEDDSEITIEQPLDYNKLLKAEEILRAKFERQKELRESRRGHKRSPVTDNYTAEMMQKNINQHTGVDVRKELNLKIKRSNGRAITSLVILLFVILALGVAVSIAILKS